LHWIGFRFDEAADQFRLDVDANPNDTEEAIWCYVSEARSKAKGPKQARESFLRVGRDPRPLLRVVYDTFRDPGIADPAPLILDHALSEKGRTLQHDLFYANLYSSLWYESVGDMTRAKKFMQDAVGTAYADRSGDYMCGLAKVHCNLRNWTT